MTTGGSNFWNSGSVPLIEPDFLESIIAAASDIALVISSGGIVLSVLVNSAEDGFGNLKHWEGRPVVEFLTNESIRKFEVAHGAYLAGTTPQRALELNHLDNAEWQYPVRYTFHRFGSEDAALLLGRDLRPIAETQQQLVQAQIALEQGYEARREFDARYRVMLGQVREAVVFVSVATGRVEDANARAAEMLGLKLDALNGANFASLFSDRSGSELTESLVTATLAEEPEPVTGKVSRTQEAVQILPSLFRAGGQRILMCRIGVAEMPEAQKAEAVKDGTHAVALFRQGTDPMLFLSDKGIVLTANDAFLDLVGATRAADVKGVSFADYMARGHVKGVSFADYMARGQIDLGLMLGSTEKSGQVNVYSTRLVDALGAKVAVEASLTRLQDGEDTIIGLVLRDAGRLEPVRGAGPTSGGLPDQGQKVVELVGTASLKEIVAETTDVVEKMCIETAVTLTRNNRVAAAEMLGLSRQSLYVKLRKYGLLSRD